VAQRNGKISVVDEPINTKLCVSVGTHSQAFVSFAPSTTIFFFFFFALLF